MIGLERVGRNIVAVVVKLLDRGPKGRDQFLDLPVQNLGEAQHQGGRQAASVQLGHDPRHGYRYAAGRAEGQDNVAVTADREIFPAPVVQPIAVKVFLDHVGSESRRGDDRRAYVGPGG